MPLGMEIDLGQAILCYMGIQLPQKGQSSQFSVHVCCGQTARWIKMQLGMELGLGPGDNVLDGDSAPQGTAPNFWPMSTVGKWSPISATAEHLLQF